MKQVLFGGASTSPSSTVYAPPMQSRASFSTEAARSAPWPTAGVLRNFLVVLSAAPAGGTSRTFTLRKNGADTALTVTISGSATTARLTGTDVAVAVGDLLAVQHTSSGSPVAATPQWSLEFEGTTAKESGYASTTVSTTGTGSVRYTAPFASDTALPTVVTNIPNVAAAAGTITRLIVAADVAPGVGAGRTFYINKNSVRQDGSGGSVNTACALVGAITSASATFSLPVVGGDLLYIEAVATGSFTVVFSLGTTFVATTDGESQLCGGTTPAVTLSGTNPNYSVVPVITGATSSTEGSAQIVGGITTIRLSAFRVVLATAPGAGKSRLLDLRKNATSPGPTLTIADTATTGSDLTNTMTVADGDLWNLRSVPTSTPAASLAQWSAIAAPATAAVTAHAETFIWMP